MIKRVLEGRGIGTVTLQNTGTRRNKLESNIGLLRVKENVERKKRKQMFSVGGHNRGDTVTDQG